MIPIVICVVLSGIITLLLIAPIMQSRPRTCYLLMMLIPALSLGAALAVFPPSIPPPPKTAIERAEMHIKQGEFSLAIQTLTESIDENGNNAETSLQLGRAYFAKGLLHAEHNEKGAALENLRQAMEVSPKDASFLADLQHFTTRVEHMTQDKETVK